MLVDLKWFLLNCREACNLHFHFLFCFIIFWSPLFREETSVLSSQSFSAVFVNDNELRFLSNEHEGPSNSYYV